jgi:hypothetical protein
LSIADGTELADFCHDVSCGSLAVLKLMASLLLYMVDIVVDHGESDADGQNSHQGEGDGGVGHEFVGLFAVIGIHFFLEICLHHCL